MKQWRRLAAVIAVLGSLVVGGLVLAGSPAMVNSTAQAESDEIAEAREGQAVQTAVSTAFGQQGRVKRDGGLFTGICEFQFDLLDAPGGTQLATRTLPDVAVKDGLYSVELDFGNHYLGEARWLYSAIKCPGDAGYTELGTEPLLATPYAHSLRPGAIVDSAVPAGSKLDAILKVVNRSANYPIGLYGIVKATSGLAIGVAGNNNSPDGYAVYGYSLPTGVGVYGESPDGFGVIGVSTKNRGVTGRSVDEHGVFGSSVKGAGVAATSVEWSAVRGVSESDTAAAISAYNEGKGPGIAASSANGLAAFFGGTTRTEVLEIVGGSDLAERFQVSGDATVEPGTVMIIDADNAGHLTPSTSAYDRKVAGIVSGAGDVDSGLVLHQEGVLEGDTVVAIAGRVYVKGEAISRAIAPGDLLTTSDLPGYAMKAADSDRAQGAVIGKAMTGLESGTGLVLVLVSLQ